MLVRHGFVYLVTRFVAGLMNFLTIILYTHLLVPQQYSRYTLLITGVGLISHLATGWLVEGIIRFCPASRQSENPIFGVIHFFRTRVLPIFLFVFLLSALFLSSKEWLVLVMFGLLILWFQSLQDISLSLLRAYLRPDLLMILVFVRSLVTLSVGWVTTYLGFGAVGASGAYLAGLVVAYVIYSTYWKDRETSTVDTRFMRQVFQYGIPLSLNTFLLQILQTADRFIIALILGEDSSGIYAAIYDITQQTLGLFVLSVSNASVPLVIAALQQGEEKKAQQYLRENISLTMTIFILVGVFFWKVAPLVGTYFIGSIYAENFALLIPFILFSLLLIGLRTHHFLIPIMVNKTTSQALISTAGAVVINILLNFSLIKNFGLLGAVFSAVVSASILLSITVVQSIKIMPSIHFIKDAACILACGLIYVAVVAALPSGQTWQTLMSGAIGGILFVAGILVLDVAGWRRGLWNRWGYRK
jgi:O-antigen/teichoic acid export membrane protein